MLVAIALFTLFGLLLGAFVWWVWSQREEAERQARTNQELAALGKSVQAVMHDLATLHGLMADHLDGVRRSGPAHLREQIDRVEEVSRSAQGMARAASRVGDPGGAGSRGGSTEGMVRLTIAMARARGVVVHTSFEGDLHYDGPDTSALRVIQNLMVNAVRETLSSGSGRIRVALDPAGLRITNAVARPELLDSRIYETGVSYADSNGMGLAIARRAASEVGWQLGHEVRGDEVTFAVTPLDSPDSAKRPGRRIDPMQLN